MKLSEAPLKKLQKVATKMGIAWDVSTEREALMLAISRAKKAAKKAGETVAELTPEQKPDPEPAVENWPDAWDDHLRRKYYAHIVGKPLEDPDSYQAYAELKLAVADKTLEAEPIKVQSGYACFGLMYSPEMTLCTQNCWVRPLCENICATRPEMQEKLAQLDQAATELAAQVQDEAEPVDAEAMAQQEAAITAPVAEQVVTPVKAKGSKAAKRKIKPVGPLVYTWTGNLDDYEVEDDDEESQSMFAIYTWISKAKKGVTVESLGKKLAKMNYDDVEESSRDILYALVEDKAVVETAKYVYE